MVTLFRKLRNWTDKVYRFHKQPKMRQLLLDCSGNKSLKLVLENPVVSSAARGVLYFDYSEVAWEFNSRNILTKVFYTFVSVLVNLQIIS